MRPRLREKLRNMSVTLPSVPISWDLMHLMGRPLPCIHAFFPLCDVQNVDLADSANSASDMFVVVTMLVLVVVLGLVSHSFLSVSFCTLNPPLFQPCMLFSIMLHGQMGRSSLTSSRTSVARNYSIWLYPTTILPTEASIIKREEEINAVLPWVRWFGLLTFCFCLSTNNFFYFQAASPTIRFVLLMLLLLLPHAQSQKAGVCIFFLVC